MRHALLVIVLSFQIGVNLSGADGRGNVQFQKHGSHSSSNNSLNRSARCIPCEQSLGAPLERGFPVTNHVNSEYRGNGADNLGYDWSPKAWGGLAYPQKSRGSMIRMGGRDGRQMLKDWNQSQGGGVRIICDTCRAYWDGARGGSNSIRDPGRFPVQNAPSFFGSKPSYWHRGRMMNSQDYETRVSSGAVGVLIKPGSRIAYIPSRSGEMIWDGVSGGGTRWDGFSNGISWVASGGPEWDHGGREQKPDYTSGSPRSNNDYFFNSNPYRPWGGQKGISSWDNAGKGYYFSNGYPGPVDFQWRDRGYASNWQYSSTNQNGWNGSSMKWNYGSKHWDENERPINRFYFNPPEDRNYVGRGGTGYIQYGHQYSNYEPWPGGSQGGYGLSRPAQGTRLNDRDPANFSPHGNKPWNYNSGNRYENRGPTLRPDWRPDPNYAGNYNKDSTGKYPTNDKNEFQKPWTGHSGYGPSKPDSGNGFPYGGNRFPGSDGSTSPIHLFYPNDEHHEGSQSGFSSPGSRPGGHPSTGNQGSSYPIGSGVSRPSAGSLIYTGGRPAGYPAEGISHPSGGGHPGSYQSSSGGNYPISSVASHSNPSSGTYPDRGSRPESYPTSSSGGSYLDGGSRPGSYPSSSLGGSYPDGGNRPGSYPSSSSGGSYSNGGNRPGSYPSSSTGGSYPNGGNRPGNYPSSSSGGSYLGEGTRPTNYPSSSGGNYDEGRRPTYGYPGSGGRPGGVYITHGSGSGGYPSDGSSSGGYSYESSRPGYSYHSENFGNYGGYPDRYPGKFPDTNRVDVYSGSGGRPLYPSTGYSNYPSYGSGGKNPPKGYYTGIITEIGPDQGPYGGSQPNHFGGSYPGDKNAYPGVYKDHYPYGGDNLNKYPSDKHRFGEDRYSSGGDNDNYPGGRDRFYYYGQDMNKDQYPSGYPSSGSSGGGGFVGSDQNQGSSQDKNAWNYGDQKDGIYHRSGGSYPPYRGGQYYTSSYLASLTSTTQQGSESKTQSVTKTDEVTQPTSTQS